MTRWAKLVARARRTPNDLRFSELSALVVRMGYRLARTRGSHHHYRKPACPIITLQRTRDGKAKPYQVRQVLAILDHYGFELD